MQRMLFTRSSARREFRLCIEASRLPHYVKPQTRVRSSFGGSESRHCAWLNHINVVTKLLGANFTAYQELKKLAHRYQPDLAELPSYQHMVVGLISGAMGPFSNAPIDTIKTREFWRDAGDIGLESLTFRERTAKNYMGAGSHCVSANIDHCKGHVAQRRSHVILQGYYTASAPRCARTSHRFRCLREGKDDHRENQRVTFR